MVVNSEGAHNALSSAGLEYFVYQWSHMINIYSCHYPVLLQNPGSQKPSHLSTSPSRASVADLCTSVPPSNHLPPLSRPAGLGAGQPGRHGEGLWEGGRQPDDPDPGRHLGAERQPVPTVGAREPATGADRAGGVQRLGHRPAGPADRVLGRGGAAGGVPRRAAAAQSQDAHPAAHHLVPGVRWVWPSSSRPWCPVSLALIISSLVSGESGRSLLLIADKKHWTSYCSLMNMMGKVWKCHI